MSTTLTKKQSAAVIRDQRIRILDLERRCLVLEFVARTNLETVRSMARARARR